MIKLSRVTLLVLALSTLSLNAALADSIIASMECQAYSFAGPYTLTYEHKTDTLVAKVGGKVTAEYSVGQLDPVRTPFSGGPTGASMGLDKKGEEVPYGAGYGITFHSPLKKGKQTVSGQLYYQQAAGSPFGRMWPISVMPLASLTCELQLNHTPATND